MVEEWMNDARKIPDEPVGYLRKVAVRAIEEKGYSPELIVDVLGISRSSVYEWLKVAVQRPLDRHPPTRSG
jgi:transposase